MGSSCQAACGVGLHHSAPNWSYCHIPPQFLRKLWHQLVMKTWPSYALFTTVAVWG